MRTHRGLDVLYLLLVIGGGVLAAGALAFRIDSVSEEIPLADLGLVVMGSGISLLGTRNSRSRAKLVSAAVAFGGLGIVMANGFVQFEGLVYVGLATMTTAGVILFVTRSTPE